MKMIMTGILGLSLLSPLALADQTSENEAASFNTHTFDHSYEEMIQELYLIQDKTLDIVMTDDYAEPVVELEQFYSEEFAARIHHQFNYDAYIEPFNWDYFTVVDSLLYRDVEEVAVHHPELIDDEYRASVHVSTSSVEDGAGNRAYFEETYHFIYDGENEIFLIDEIDFKQIW